MWPENARKVFYSIFVFCFFEICLFQNAVTTLQGSLFSTRHLSLRVFNYFNDSNDSDVTEQLWIQNFRMPRPTFVQLCDAVEPLMAPAVCLWLLASTDKCVMWPGNAIKVFSLQFCEIYLFEVTWNNTSKTPFLHWDKKKWQFSLGVFFYLQIRGWWKSV